MILFVYPRLVWAIDFYFRISNILEDVQLKILILANKITLNYITKNKPELQTELKLMEHSQNFHSTMEVLN